MFSSLPDWGVELLRQFPMFGLAVVCTGVAVWYITKQHVEHLARMDREFAAHLKSKDAEIEWLRAQVGELRDDAKKDRDKLQRLLAGVKNEKGES